jgi:hypothetical protein
MKVYLDMDGLLANLFDTVALGMLGKHYKELTEEEKELTRQIWIDREGRAKEFFKRHGGVKNFFANLPLFGENGELTHAIIKTVINIAGSYSICSCPAGIDRAASEAGKREWIKKHLNPPPEEMRFITNKAEIAFNKETGKPNILIDDFPKYIKAWEAARGEPIEMRTDEYSSAGEIEQYLTKKLLAAKKKIEGTVKESFDTIYENFLLKFSL